MNDYYLIEYTFWIKQQRKFLIYQQTLVLTFFFHFAEQKQKWNFHFCK
jgi:hypothetical protein